MKDDDKDLVEGLVSADRVASTGPMAQRVVYIKTAVAERSVATIRYAWVHGELVLIVGPSGIGKTTSALAAAAEIGEAAIYISVPTACATELGVLKLIAKALGLAVGERPNQSDLFEAIVVRMAGRQLVLIVDEAHKLAAWRRDQALHVLRDLQDATKCGMVWVGMATLARYIQSGRANGMETLDQIQSRIAITLDLGEVAGEAGGGPGGDGAAGEGGGLVTVADIRAMLAARKLRYTGGALRYLLALAREDGAGAFRTIDKLLAFAETVARGGEITEKLLRGIQARRLGLRAAEVLENRIALRMPQKVSVA